MKESHKKTPDAHLEIAVINSMASEELVNIGSEFGELALDAFLEDDILKEVPFIGTIVALIKVGINLHEQLFIKKIYKFLVALSEIPQQERKDFVRDLESRGMRQRVGEAILLILDKLDSMTKPELIGRIFKAHIEGLIDYETALRYSAIIERIFLPDLNELVRADQGEEISQNAVEQLFSLGLMSLAPQQGLVFGKSPNRFYVNEHGKKLMEIVLEKRP